jgi:hypothetical protein
LGVIRIDDELLKKLKLELAKDENKYKYGSLAAFINSIIYEKLKKGELK